MRYRGDQLRQQLQALAQPGELAGPHAAQCDPGGDPLDVGHAAQDLVKIRVVQRCHGLVPVRQHGAVPQRVMQPETKEPAAHAGRAFVEQGEQGRRRLAAQCFGELEIAARGRIEPHVLAGALGLHRGNVRERLTLRLAGVLEQRAARADRHRKVLAAVPGERRRAELLQELSLPAVYVEMPGGKPRDEESVQHEVVRRQDLGGSYAPQLVG